VDEINPSEPGVDASYAAALRASLDQLATLPTANLPLPELLVRVAEHAVAAIPGADGAGVTLMESGQPDMLAASTDFVAEVDRIQYGLGEGPCISAALERRTVRCGALDGAANWPAFSPRVADLGVHSVLSLPLVLDDETVGAINVYAHQQNAFSDLAQQLGEQFARPAAVATHNALVVRRAHRLAEQLQRALEQRAVVDQAIGVLIGARECTADEGKHTLETMSAQDGVRTFDAAKRVIADAGRSSRSPSDAGGSD
jgi:GAF domain-containing protein